jgi:hypothetical protein
MTTNDAAGQCMAMPDVCNTSSPAGPIPIPYPNIAMTGDASAFTCSLKVKVMNKNVVTTMTEISRTSGDEAGSSGGVVSGLNMGPAKFQVGSMKVKVEGNPPAYLTGMVGQNGSSANAPTGVQTTPTQPKVIVSP